LRSLEATAALAAAEAAVAAATAEVDRLRAQLATEHAASVTEPTGPRLLTWEDGVAAARKRHPGRTRGEQTGADAGTDDVQPADITSVEGARAEARRRGAARRTGGAA
jgi:hypothetical protein